MTEARDPAPGPLALVGSGEYLPQMAAIEAALLRGRPSRYVQLATAAVPDATSSTRVASSGMRETRNERQRGSCPKDNSRA